MVDEVNAVEFGAICEHSAFGPRFSSEEYDPNGNVACLRTMDIDSDGRINFPAMPLAKLDLKRFKSHILRRGDVVITRTGAYLGKAAVFSEFHLPVLPGAFSIRFRLRRELADPIFVRYFFNSVNGQAAIQSIATGSAQPNINIPNLHSLRIPLPPLVQQEASARILGALDDKIELNRRMNATLEAMARALFQSWFVDFDPVHAKVAGRQPVARDEATAARFPHSFEESELGEIPSGWEVSPLSRNIELLSGGTPKTSEAAYWDGEIPWYSVKDAPADSDIWVIRTEKNVTQLGIDNSAAQILPEGTTIISARGTVGKLALVGTPMAMNQSCYGVRGKGGYGSAFVYFLLRHVTTDLQLSAWLRISRHAGHLFQLMSATHFTSCRPGISRLSATPWE